MSNKNLADGEKPNHLYEDDIRRIAASRDLFVVGCLTGQRISDYKRINKEMITEFEGRKFITLIQEKTKKKVMIPLDKRVGSILDKHNGKLPKVTEQTFNKHLRLIAEVMGWIEVPNFDKARVDGDTGRRFCDLVWCRAILRDVHLPPMPIVTVCRCRPSWRSQGIRQK